MPPVRRSERLKMLKRTAAKSRFSLPADFQVSYGWILKFMDRHGLLRMDSDVLQDCTAAHAGHTGGGVKRVAESDLPRSGSKKLFLDTQSARSRRNVQRLTDSHVMTEERRSGAVNLRERTKCSSTHNAKALPSILGRRRHPDGTTPGPGSSTSRIAFDALTKSVHSDMARCKSGIVPRAAHGTGQKSMDGKKKSQTSQVSVLSHSISVTSLGGRVSVSQNQVQLTVKQNPGQAKKPASLSRTGAAILTAFLHGYIARKNELRAREALNKRISSKTPSTRMSLQEYIRDHQKRLAHSVDRNHSSTRDAAASPVPSKPDRFQTTSTSKVPLGLEALGGSFQALHRSSKLHLNVADKQDPRVLATSEALSTPTTAPKHERLEGIVNTLWEKQRPVDEGVDLSSGEPFERFPHVY
ncbi:uncharacterized protein LOC135396772 isoform X2 [Ornithodoros turicata]|uniref:uncharacterized protein LOC135396758 isoform X2 n=1 Tax=Ornithodoros turicata TaxID=34597 RepID=UPI00313987D2